MGRPDDFYGEAPVITRLLKSGGSILCFHSITTFDLPAQGDAHVSLERFLAFVRLARRLGEIVPLSELVRRHMQNQSTSGLVALTFDDAYAAVHRYLKEVIEREAVPLAIFVVTGAAASGAQYWWDRIDDVFAQVTAERWRMFEIACGLPEEFRTGQPPEYGPLRPFRQWVLATYAGRSSPHLESELDSLEAEVGCRTRHRSMTFEELAELSVLPGVEIGVHTASHPVLPLLSDHDVCEEIVTSYNTVRDRFTNALPILAIPFGLYDARTLRVARAAGMSAALTLGGGLNRTADRSTLPRLCLVRAVTRARLALYLLGIENLIQRCARCPLPPYPDLPSAVG
jgi:peptidoglycan/xylan/chitin deacetylase (PgdA/CDA1 family)